MNNFHNCRACITEVRCAELNRCLESSHVGDAPEKQPRLGALGVIGGSKAPGFNVDLALALSSYVHEHCKEVPHDIGIYLAIIAEEYLNAKSGAPNTPDHPRE
jgi:hypothetical protein